MPSRMRAENASERGEKKELHDKFNGIHWQQQYQVGAAGDTRIPQKQDGVAIYVGISRGCLSLTVVTVPVFFACCGSFPTTTSSRHRSQVPSLQHLNQPTEMTSALTRDPRPKSLRLFAKNSVYAASCAWDTILGTNLHF